MKTKLALSLMFVATLVPMTTKASHDSAARGALIGGVAGAIIGSSGDRHDVLAGAAFGAAAGALLGAASDDSHGYRHGYGYAGSRGHGRLSVSYGIGYGHGGYYSHHRPYRRYGHRSWAYPSVYYSYSRPVYAPVNYVEAVPVQTVQAEPQPAATQQAQPAPQNVTIINNYYGGSSGMGTANSMFGR